MSTGRLPLFVDLNDRAVLVVGGGGVATRRVLRLVEAGARVRVVAPEVDERIATVAAAVDRRAFEPHDVAGAWLVLACTDDAAANAAVAAASEAKRIWCVRADDADQSPAWLAAASTHDDVTVAVSAGGDPGRDPWLDGGM